MDALLKVLLKLPIGLLYSCTITLSRQGLAHGQPRARFVFCVALEVAQVADPIHPGFRGLNLSKATQMC